MKFKNSNGFWNVKGIEKVIKNKLGDDLRFDDFDVNGYPIFVSENPEKEEDEYYVKDNGDVYYTNGWHHNKMFNLREAS